jgi:hypothetical protein
VPIPDGNLAYVAWRAAGVEARERRAGTLGGDDWGQEALTALTGIARRFSAPRDVAWEVPLPLGVVRTLATLVATTVVVDLDPVFGALPHLPWYMTGKGKHTGAHSDLGELAGSSSLADARNWEGESILVLPSIPKLRRGGRQEPLKTNKKMIQKTVDDLKEPTRVALVELGGGKNDWCVVTVQGDRYDLEVNVIDNEAARRVRPLKKDNVKRTCSTHAERCETKLGRDWEFTPRQGRWMEDGAPGAPTQRSRPLFPKAWDFSVEAMILEGMDTALPPGWWGEDEMEPAPQRAARIGLFTEEVREELKNLGFKKQGQLLRDTRSAILEAQYKRIRSKSHRRAFHVFDDMG